MHIYRHSYCSIFFFFFTVWRRAEIAFGLVLYRVPCQCRAVAWPFIVINRKGLKDHKCYSMFDVDSRPD